jgi:hypothetical protein
LVVPETAVPAPFWLVAVVGAPTAAAGVDSGAAAGWAAAGGAAAGEAVAAVFVEVTGAGVGFVVVGVGCVAGVAGVSTMILLDLGADVAVGAGSG